MSSNGAQMFLHKTAAAIGMDSGGENQCTAAAYSFQTNFGTQFKKAAGKDAAIKAMGHRAGSNTICENYDVGNQSLDFFGIGSGEGEDSLDSGRNAAVYAVLVDVPGLNLAQLVGLVPMIAIYLKQAQNLQSYMVLGGSDGREQLVYEQERQNLEDTDTPESIYAEQAAKDQCKSIMAEEHHKSITVLQQPSTLIKILQQAQDKMLEQGLLRGEMDRDDKDNTELKLSVEVQEPENKQIDKKDEQSITAVQKEAIEMME
ncbi:hypothetical protein K438DRAFT_1997019 [Mycena galopus ATCC 62051]|nr:hypothetical protein K438DRAFT_1997019 [Mycena galopus ATCC 62051]